MNVAGCILPTLALAALVTSCQEISTQGIVDLGDSAAGDFGQAPDLVRGRCYWRDGTGITCRTSNGCSPPATCQEGRCCSGEMDPDTCQCNCNGLPPCIVPGEICCRAGFGWNVPEPEVKKCRAEPKCFPW